MPFFKNVGEFVQILFALGVVVIAVYGMAIGNVPVMSMALGGMLAFLSPHKNKEDKAGQ